MARICSMKTSCRMACRVMCVCICLYCTHTHTHRGLPTQTVHTCTFLASVLEMYALTKSQSSLSVGEGKKCLFLGLSVMKYSLLEILLGGSSLSHLPIL